ncbi:unnamed protein product, partial [Sphenostylis stenocarpa]
MELEPELRRNKQNTLDWGDDGTSMEDYDEKLDIETEVSNASNLKHTLEPKEQPRRERKAP